jgi:hypothetical protein
MYFHFSKSSNLNLKYTNRIKKNVKMEQKVNKFENYCPYQHQIGMTTLKFSKVVDFQDAA